MTYNAVQEIADAAGVELARGELEAIVATLARRAEVRQAGGSLASPEEDLVAAADELAREVEESWDVERRNRLLDLRIHHQIMRSVEAVEAAGGDPALAISARNVGGTDKVLGIRKSVEARAKGLLAEYLDALTANLEERDLLAVFNSGELDREIAHELWELSRSHGRPGILGSGTAERIAKVIDEYRRASVARENRAGAWTKAPEGTVLRHAHDAREVERAGYGPWQAFVGPLLGPGLLLGTEDFGSLLRAIYDGIVAGEDVETRGAGETDGARLLAGERGQGTDRYPGLRFRDADAWHDYNRAFGRRTLRGALLAELERAAWSTALMEAWGTRPRRMFARVLGVLEDKHHGGGKRGPRDALGRQFEAVADGWRVHVAPGRGRLEVSARARTGLSKLGEAAVTVFGDPAVPARMVARSGGRNLLKLWSDRLDRALAGLSPGDRRLAATFIAVGLAGQLADLAGRFWVPDARPGGMTGLLRQYFKLGELSFWGESNRRGLALMFAHHLALGKSRAFGELDDDTRADLRRSGIDAENWDRLRRMVRREADGHAYLWPDTMEATLRSYYAGRAEEASARHDRRHPLGVAGPFVHQFRVFPLTLLSGGLDRPFGADGVRAFFRDLVFGTAEVQGLAHLVVATTVLAHLSRCAARVGGGGSPEDPEKLAGWQGAMKGGGALGLYGDFLLGELEREARRSSTGRASRLGELLDRVRRGDSAAAPEFRDLVSDFGFMDAFYTRIGFDYLVLFQFQEAASPGFLRRMEWGIRRHEAPALILPPGTA